MQTQGFMHQGQNFGFNPQMGTQIPHQLGNLGMNMPGQFNQQQAGKFVSNRKTVKITHPDTHEELKLDNKDDGSSISRPHHNGPPQSQALPNYTPSRPIGYPNSYTAGPPLFPVQSSLSSTGSPLIAGSQVPRSSFSVIQAPPTAPSLNHSASNTFSVNKKGPSLQGKPDVSISDNVKDVQIKAPPAQSTSARVIVRTAACSGGEKVIESNAVVETKPRELLNSAVDTGVVRKDSQLKPDSSPADVETSDQGTCFASGGSPRVSTSTPHANPIKSASTGNVQNFPGERADSLPLPQDNDSSTAVASECGGVNTSSNSSVSKDGMSEAVQSPITPVAALSDVSSADRGVESSSRSSENNETQNVVNGAVQDQYAKQIDLHLQEKNTRQSTVTREQGREHLGDDALNVMEAVKKTDHGGKLKNVDPIVAVLESSQKVAESISSCTEGDNMDKQASSFGSALSTVSNGTTDPSNSVGIASGVSSKDYDMSKSSMADVEATSIPTNHSETNLEQVDAIQNVRPSSPSGIESGQNKGFVEPNKTKNSKGKKKWKEMLQKADALGTTSDLYMAYKGPEGKKEAVVAPEITADSKSKEVSAVFKQEPTTKNEDDQSKAELDDWEDAADISTPKLQSSGQGDGVSSLHHEEGVIGKKYSRDFLLKFSEQCTSLPVGFEITSDIANALMCVNVSAARGDHEFPSPGKMIDRQTGAARLDRRGSSTTDADRWNKVQGPYPAGRDPGTDLAHGSNVMGFRSGPGPNFGVLRNPRAQGSGQPAGGILSGPMHSLGFQGIQRNYSDADRWQRATNYNKGLMPAPQTPAQVMHRAEKKYEVGKITDEEQAKQRRLKGILNKLTPQNFEKLFEQVKEVNIDNAVTLTGVISQIFDKALMEPTFCEMYANFCYDLASELPDLSVDNEKITFRRLLLNKCQEEFERGEREEQEANEADGEGEIRQTEEEREEKRLKARRRMLGNIRLIGELYKKKMLTERIMHECIKKLLGDYQKPDEENIEALCKLMSTIGEMIDHPIAKGHMDAYFDIMGQLSNNMKLSSRVRFMLKDAIDLRKNKWQQRRKVEGPKKIEEVHRDAAQERQGQAARLSRGPSMNSATRRSQPVEFSPRGPMLSTPVGQGSGFRGMSSQVRGYGMQDVRMDERNVLESRTLSVPLPQRSGRDEQITLGPQGGLAREMAYRGQPSVSNSPLLDTSSSYGDPRRIAGGLNGYSTASDRGVYSSREYHFARHNSERLSSPGAFDQSHNQEHNASFASRDSRFADRNAERSRPTTPPVARTGGLPAQNLSSEKVWPEERLRDMSIAAIKEYYSAKDEKEVALCIKDLNAPSFYPTVVSIWVTDSFERKDMERDMLAKLLVNLTKPREGLFSPAQLIEGFQSVLSTLEDAVNDAPRAPKFLGQIFGKIVVENVLPLKEVGRLIHEGGEEPGSLREVGLAADVIGSVLEMVRSEKGESILKEICAACNLRLEDFRPPDPLRSR
uniref:Eukaryotic translation initiation factor 4G n=1 Tax=Opuntia streptacantha TaxID=393608 RepID=A0A7C9APQ7_OPUST